MKASQPPLKHILFIRICWILLGYFPPIYAENIKYEELDIPDQSGQAMTVKGLVNPEELGQTLMHEHLLADVRLSPDQPERWAKIGIPLPTTEEELARWNMPFSINKRTELLRYYLGSKDAYSLNNVDDATNEVTLYKKLGGNTVVDATSMGIRVKNHPHKLHNISKTTNVNIVLGTGFYRSAWHPNNMDQRSLVNLTRNIVKEIVIGVDGTDIKAGIIGEIPVENLIFQPKESNEVRVLRAVARASKLTGAAISLHCDFSKMDVLHSALDLLEIEGADLSRVIVGHAINFDLESSDISSFESVLRRGVYLQFDMLGMPHFEMHQGSLTVAIKKLIDRGYSKQLLVSQDIFYKMQLTKYGGHGLTYVHSFLLPYLRARGIGENAIENILENNPRRVLTFSKPKLL